jgi:hypothetical protein
MAINSLPASTSLLAEIDFVGPDRGRESDGTIGDSAHRASSSDHNPDDTPGSRTPGSDSDSTAEVHARDVTDRGPWIPGWSMERIVQICRGDRRLQNIIYNRRIWSASWGWTERPYSGSNPHDKHAHFGFRYGSGSGASNPENDTSAWGIKAAREQEIREATMTQPTQGQMENAAAAGVLGYDGRGLPGGSTNFLTAFTEMANTIREDDNDLDGVAADVAALGQLTVAGLARVEAALARIEARLQTPPSVPMS